MRVVRLDALLSTAQAALWLQMTERELLAKSKGRKAKIPAMWLNGRVVRYHPRTILAKLATDAGVPVEIIAASFSIGKPLV